MESGKYQKYKKVKIQDFAPSIELQEEQEPEKVKLSQAKFYWEAQTAGTAREVLYYKMNADPNWVNGYYMDYPDGLPGALIAAYVNEQDVLLTPDDVWITILHAFYLHVQANAEILRKKFVAHEGKEDIVISHIGCNTPEDAEQIMEQFIAEACARSRGDIRKLMCTSLYGS